MGDKSDVDVDDLVTVEELEDLRDEIQGEIEDHEVDVDPADVGAVTEDEIDSFVDQDRAAEVADRRVTQHLDHLINEDCDTESCEHKRDGIAEMVAERLGVDTDELEDAASGEADEGEPEDAETTETGGEGDHRGGESDGDDEMGNESDGGTTDGSDADADDSEDVETNVFGEPV